MYEELIQRLRETSMDFGEADHVSVMLLEAANVIEEEDMAFRCLERDYKVLCRHLPKWISVTDRLPDDAGIYIICDHYGNVMSRHFCKKSDKFAGYWHANGSKFYGNPTHWMPLPSAPEPPKEET